MSSDDSSRAQSRPQGDQTSEREQRLFRRVNERIGEGLMRIGVLSAEQVGEVSLRQERGDRRMFGRIAIELGYASEQEILAYIQLGLSNGHSAAASGE